MLDARYPNNFGGAKMNQANATQDLKQIWEQLSQEDQNGVIRLMAQMILKRAESQRKSGEKEGSDEQNPS
jgi:hypothetical protein